jgi:hypothetical protein
MDLRAIAEDMNNKIEQTEINISIQRQEYEDYLAEATRRSKELLVKLKKNERTLEEMKTKLSKIEKKQIVQAKTIDAHLYSRRLKNIFTRKSCLQRLFIYRKILETNDQAIDSFICSSTIENIGDLDRHEYFENLIKSGRIIKEHFDKGIFQIVYVLIQLQLKNIIIISHNRFR